MKQFIEQVNTPLSGMAGKIADSYTIVPQYKGSYPKTNQIHVF
jgi:hypothetical protein